MMSVVQMKLSFARTSGSTTTRTMSRFGRSFGNQYLRAQTNEPHDHAAYHALQRSPGLRFTFVSCFSISIAFQARGPGSLYSVVVVRHCFDRRYECLSGHSVGCFFGYLYVVCGRARDSELYA